MQYFNMAEYARRTCNGSCKKFRVLKPPTGGRYQAGHVRCQTCDIWMDYTGCHLKDGSPATVNSDGWSCNCCGYKVRMHPRNKRYKEKLRISNDTSRKLEDKSSDGDIDTRSGFTQINLGEPLDELQQNPKAKLNAESNKKPSSRNQEITPGKFEFMIRRFDEERTIFNGYTNWEYYNDEQKNEQREEFMPKFPIEKIQDITIEEYVQGLHDKTGQVNRFSFSYLIEQKAFAFGSARGGTAQKFGIYYNQSKDGFQYRKNKYRNPDEAFKSVLKQVQKILDAGSDFVKDRDVQKLSNIIDEKGYDIYPQVRSKMLATYFSNTFLTISAEKRLNKMLNYFKIPFEQLDGKIIQKQFKLIEQKNKHQIMKKWSTEDYSYFLWMTLCTECYINIKETKSITLRLPLGKRLEDIKKSIQEDLLIDGNIIDRIISSLYAGRNILLTGPVGTGKTDLAQTIPKILNYYPEVYTATSDWTTQDVIGGVFPKVENGKIIFRTQKGCVTHTVSKNWEDGTGNSIIRKRYRAPDHEADRDLYNGVWLVIDEFNRANIDQAFGQLFTAFEHKNQLKAPTDIAGIDFQTYIIPDDYRIIGTLNAHDKHFLFNLSDALKRRFDFIEIGTPPRDPENREISMMRKKAAVKDEFNNEINDLDKSNEGTDEKLYEIIAFIRKSKQLGTALLISMFKDILVYHKMGQRWDSSLDSALTKTIISQIEDLPTAALGNIKRFVNGDMASFFISFSHHDHSEKLEDYVRELEKYKKYYYERFKGNFSKKWVEEFKGRNLSGLAKRGDSEQADDYKSITKELNPWTDELQRPALPLFKKSLERLIEEKEFATVNALESGLN